MVFILHLFGLSLGQQILQDVHQVSGTQTHTMLSKRCVQLFNCFSDYTVCSQCGLEIDLQQEWELSCLNCSASGIVLTVCFLLWERGPSPSRQPELLPAIKTKKISPHEQKYKWGSRTRLVISWMETLYSPTKYCWSAWAVCRADEKYARSSHVSKSSGIACTDKNLLMQGRADPLWNLTLENEEARPRHNKSAIFLVFVGVMVVWCFSGAVPWFSFLSRFYLQILVLIRISQWIVWEPKNAGLCFLKAFKPFHPRVIVCPFALICMCVHGLLMVVLCLWHPTYGWGIGQMLHDILWKSHHIRIQIHNCFLFSLLLGHDDATNDAGDACPSVWGKCFLFCQKKYVYMIKI